MKFFALGVGVLCALLLSIPAFRKLQHVPAPTQTGASELFAATPKLLPQPASGLPAALPPGTVVSVTLTQPIDSARDAYGKAYEASVDTIEGQPIAPASKATVVLVNNNTGWLTQLTQLTIKGRKFQVSSGAGSVVGAEQASEPTPLLRLALGQSALSNARDSSQRVLLPPATQLRFALIETGTAGRTAAGNSHHASPAGGLREGLASGGCSSYQTLSQTPHICATRATCRIVNSLSPTTSPTYLKPPTPAPWSKSAGMIFWSRSTRTGLRTTRMPLPSATA